MGASGERIVVITPAGLGLLRTTPISKVEYQALWTIVALLGPAGGVLSQAEVANTLNTSVPYINRALKNLCAAGLLFREEKVGTHYRYRLNPAYFRLIVGKNELAHFR